MPKKLRHSQESRRAWKNDPLPLRGEGRVGPAFTYRSGWSDHSNRWSLSRSTHGPEKHTPCPACRPATLPGTPSGRPTAVLITHPWDRSCRGDDNHDATVLDALQLCPPLSTKIVVPIRRARRQTRQVALALYPVTALFPRQEAYGLASQIVDAPLPPFPLISPRAVVEKRIPNWLASAFRK